MTYVFKITEMRVYSSLKERKNNIYNIKTIKIKTTIKKKTHDIII